MQQGPGDPFLPAALSAKVFVTNWAWLSALASSRLNGDVDIQLHASDLTRPSFPVRLHIPYIFGMVGVFRRVARNIV